MTTLTASSSSSGDTLTPVAINSTSQTPLKLDSTNYLAWKIQFKSLLTGYDLFGFLDGSLPCPPKTIEAKDTTAPNPKYLYWIRQDQLLLSAIITSLTPTIISFIAKAETSKEAWDILAKTYGTASRGRIMALKQQIHHPVKGSKTITEFMHGIRLVVDELALLGCTTDSDDIVIKILNGLDDQYKEISNAIQARDTTLSFDELHDKLLSHEAQLSARSSLPPATTAPATAFVASPSPTRPAGSYRGRGRGNRGGVNQFGRGNSPNGFGQPRGYQGKCQLCGEFGHSARQCSTFSAAPWQAQMHQPAYTQRPPYNTSTPRPAAHTAHHQSLAPSPSD